MPFPWGLCNWQPRDEKSTEESGFYSLCFVPLLSVSRVSLLEFPIWAALFDTTHLPFSISISQNTGQHHSVQFRY
jgi:hypothetical protein